MLDLKYIRENLEEAERRLRTRGGDSYLDGFRDLDNRRLTLLRESETLKALRNSVSDEIARIKDKSQARTRSWRCARCPSGSRAWMKSSNRWTRN